MQLEGVVEELHNVSVTSGAHRCRPRNTTIIRRIPDSARPKGVLEHPVNLHCNGRGRTDTGDRDVRNHGTRLRGIIPRRKYNIQERRQRANCKKSAIVKEEENILQ